MALNQAQGGFASSVRRHGLSSRPLIAVVSLGWLICPTTVIAAPPVANPDFATTRSSPTAGEQVAIDPLANDSDPDGDPLQYLGASGPSFGTITESPTGLIRYTPNPGFVGTDYISYDISDGTSSASATITITVNADLAPVANDDTATILANLPGLSNTVSIPMLTNDSDPDDATLSYNDIVIVQQPQNGTVDQSCVGNCLPFEYHANPGFRGTDTFTYRVSDALGTQSNVATVTVTVTNNPPVAVDDTGQSVANGGAIFINATLNDSDADSDFLTITGVTQGSLGTVTIDPSNLVHYQATPGLSGTDTFSYTIDDGHGGTATASISIDVQAAPNQPPVAVIAGGDRTIADTDNQPGEVFPIDGSGSSDPEGGSLVYNWSVNGQLVSSGSANGIPGIPTDGVSVVTLVVVDPLGASSAPASVTYTILPPNATPTASIAGGNRTIPDTNGLPGEPVAMDGSASSDPDGTIATYTWSVNGQPVPGATGPTPTLQLADGINAVGLVVVDNGGKPSAPVSVTVTVGAPNSAPTASIAGGNRTVADSNGTPGESVAVDGSGSSDIDGTIASYAWSVNGVPVPGAVGPTPTLQLADGANAVSLVVTDNSNLASAPATVTITVSAPNAAPVAAIAGGNRSIADTNGAAGELVAMDGSASSDSDGTVASYEWSVNGQVVPAATGPRPNLQLADGASTVSLVTVDNLGARSAPATVTITVQRANGLPVVSIEVGSSSIPDSDGQPGENVPFRGTATDPDGTVSTSTFRWIVNDQVVTAANGQASPILPLANGTNSITLTATDNSGGEGSATVSVAVGEPSALENLPGVQGNDNLESTAAATDSTCSTLAKADPAALTPDELNLRNTCSTIYANAGDNPQQVTEALTQISAQQVTAQQKTAISYASNQMVNVAARLTALRQGARGVSLSGLNLGGGASKVPVTALAALGKKLMSEGGASGDDDGGLLDDRLGIFLNGSFRFGNKDATSRETGFDFDAKGVTLGADYRFTDAFVAGFALGYGQASADFDANGGSQDSDNYSGSLYGSWYGKRGYLDGIVTLGSVSYDTLRKISLFDGSITDKALGSTDGTQYALGVSGGLDYVKSGLTFGPNLALNYIRADINGFKEKTTGTSGLAMAFQDQSADSLTMKAGAHLNYSFSRKWGVLSPQARFDMVREFANDSQKLTVRYANDPVVAGQGSNGAFVIFTDNPDKYYFLWAVGFAAQLANGFSGFVDYEQTEGLDTITSGEVSAGLRYQTRFR